MSATSSATNISCLRSDCVLDCAFSSASFAGTQGEPVEIRQRIAIGAFIIRIGFWGFLIISIV